MTVLTSHTAVRGVGAWSFGAYDYGIEPLVLPPVGEAPAPMTHSWWPVEEEWRDALSEAATLSCSECLVRPSDDAEELFWFRWITGHQTTFLLWRLLAQLIQTTSDRRRLHGATVLVDGCSAMFVYTGSGSSRLYERVIRPTMRRHHRSFSGSWAPDFRPVRDLFRHRLPILMTDAGARLAEALQLHDHVHDEVARKLVPGGRSLLQQAPPGRLQAADLQDLLYDSYFSTARRPVTIETIVAQLVRRLVAIVQDVSANGLEIDGDRRGLSGPLDGDLPLALIPLCLQVGVEAIAVASAGGEHTPVMHLAR